MSNYQNGKIYIIKSNETTDVYIGSTIKSLNDRFSGHKSKYKNNKLSSAKLLLQYNDCWIELLEHYPCENKQQLCKREGDFIRLYGDKCVNREIAGRTRTEWEHDMDDHIKQRRKVFYEKNKVEILEKQALNKDKKREYDMKYREEKAEKIKARRKLYYQNNSERIKQACNANYQKIKDIKNEKVVCPICDRSVNKSYLKAHQNTKVCI